MKNYCPISLTCLTMKSSGKIVRDKIIAIYNKINNEQHDVLPVKHHSNYSVYGQLSYDNK